MAYDYNLGAVMMYGGRDAVGFMTDLWVGGPNFTSATAPSGNHTQSSLAFDQGAGEMVLFTDARTCTHHGTAWTTRSLATHPSARYGQRMVYSVSRDRIVLFGGNASGSAQADTWEYRWQSAWPEEVCDNGGVDDDGDYLGDCADPDCEGRACSGGTCTGGVCQ
jgi:hypothetical protein